MSAFGVSNRTTSHGGIIYGEGQMVWKEIWWMSERQIVQILNERNLYTFAMLTRDGDTQITQICCSIIWLDCVIIFILFLER